MPYDIAADDDMQRRLHWYNGWSRAHQKALMSVQHAVPWSVYRASRARRRMLQAHQRLLQRLVQIDEMKGLLIDRTEAKRAARAARPG